MGTGKMGNGRKCKRSVWLSESWGKEAKECVVKWWDKAAVRRKEVFAASDEEAI